MIDEQLPRLDEDPPEARPDHAQDFRDERDDYLVLKAETWNEPYDWGDE